jgi:hybrid polyketide synthase/nonribosomal peptide synthetase ACE1
MAWGDAELQVEAFEFSRLPYDLALDIIDVPNGECIHILEVRKELYGKAGAERILESFELLINAFASKPELTLNEPAMFKGEGIKQTLAYSRGKHVIV